MGTDALEYTVCGYAVTVVDSRVMPDVAVVCPDCKAEAGVECHPDCSTFWTEEE